MPLKHTRDKYSPGKSGNMPPGNSINVYLQSHLLISKLAYTTFFFFFKITFYVEVSYNGEYLLFIHYLISLFPSQVPTEVEVASPVGQPIVEDSLSLSFSFGRQFVQVSHSKYISGFSV